MRSVLLVNHGMPEGNHNSSSGGGGGSTFVLSTASPTKSPVLYMLFSLTLVGFVTHLSVFNATARCSFDSPLSSDEGTKESMFRRQAAESDNIPILHFPLPPTSSNTLLSFPSSHKGTQQLVPAATEISTTTTTTEASQFLPSSYRIADVAQCAKQFKSEHYAHPSTLPKVSLDHQTSFAAGGFTKIARGSGDVNLAGPILNLLSRQQHTRGIYGSVAELGVHHGRFTGFLFVTARMSEKLVVADLFETLQDKNVDKSGLGDKRRFLKGLATYGLSEAAVHHMFTGSTDEIPFDWSEQAGFDPFRLISVDAGHTAALTFNDLQLAFCNLLRGGIVILDDWFHSIWPGVVEGFFQYTAHGGPLVQDSVFPILVCESKLYVTNDKEFHQLYYDVLLSDDTLSSVLTPYAHEKERGKLLYEMNGVNYLKCKSRTNMTSVQPYLDRWVEQVY